MRRRWAAPAAFLILFPFAGPADAHKVVAAAWADGADVEGEVGLSDGTVAAPGTVVEVTGPDGVRLGEAVTGVDGLFRFTPSVPVPHTFRADLGAGHVAAVTLELDALPAGLGTVEAGGAATRSAPAADAAPVSVPADLDSRIAVAVRREVKPLRKELAALRERTGLQQVLGGLGYIAGIFGLLFFVYARRSRGA